MLKKNIAKLLVFAMILSMLPFSAVTAGAANPRTDDADCGYALISDSNVTVTGKSNDSRTLVKQNGGKGESDNPYIFKYDTATTTNKNYVVVNDASQVTVKFNVNTNTECVYYLNEDTTNATLSEKNKLTPTNNEVSKTIDVTFADDKNEADVTACFATYSVKKDTTYYKTYYKFEFTAKKEAQTATYSITQDAVSIKVGETKTLTPILKYGNETVTEDVTFTYTLATDATCVTLATGTGTITGRAVGNTTLTVKATHGNQEVATLPNITITVTDADGKPKHAVNVAQMQDGTVEVRPETGKFSYTDGVYSVEKDAKVTLIVKPNNSYQLQAHSLTYTIDDDVAKEVLKDANNTYSFTMPDCAVTISATFEKDPETTGKHTVTVNTAGEAVGKVVASGTYEVGSDVILTVTERPVGYDVYITARDTDGNVNVTEVAKNKSYKFTMPDSDVTVTAEFRERHFPEKLTVQFNDATETNFAHGELALNGMVEGRWYVIDIQKVDTYAGVVSSYICIQGDDTEEVTIPCASGTRIQVTETLNGIKEEDMEEDNGAEYLVENLKGSPGEMKEGTRKPGQSYADGVQTLSDTDDTPEQASNFEGAQFNDATKTNFAHGELVLSGMIKGRWYVIDIQKVDAYAGVVSGYVCVRGDETGTFSMPCASGTRIQVTETLNGIKEEDMEEDNGAGYILENFKAEAGNKKPFVR